MDLFVLSRLIPNTEASTVLGVYSSKEKLNDAMDVYKNRNPGVELFYTQCRLNVWPE